MPHFTNYEHGVRSPDPGTLERLAEVLEVPVEQLTADEPDVVDPAAVSFRSLSRTPAASRRRAIAAIPDAEDFVRWLRAHYQLPAVDVPDVADEDPETAATAVRRAWGLGNAPAPDMVNLLEHHGVRVFSLGVVFDDVDALSVWRGDVPFVFLSQRKSGERGRMDAAHELGHLSLDDARQRLGASPTALAADLNLRLEDLRQLVFDRPLVGVSGAGELGTPRRGQLRLVE